MTCNSVTMSTLILIVLGLEGTLMWNYIYIIILGIGYDVW
jgi:hypothetical protein